MARRFTLQARSAAEDVDFAHDLNPEQLAVATAGGGPMLVVAGAGTGKTRALTYRLAWLVAHGVEPGRILLMTFTNRAAREMLHRVGLLVKHETRNLWGGTFHHIANRVLRTHGGRIGVPPDFSIIDRQDAKSLMGSCLAESKVKIGKRRFPGKSVLVSMSGFVQNTLEPLDAMLARRYPMFQRESGQIAAVLRDYALRKRDRALLDYDDLLSALHILLRDHRDVRDLLAGQFMHVLVDEYQDTNAIQGEIVDMLASQHGNVCVVGDDSQAIYSFRGPSFRNIITFRQRYPKATEYRLERNYRSVPEILALANASIAVNRERLPKNLHATRPGGLRPALVSCHDHFVQSRFVAEYVLHLLDEGWNLMDLAVLYRSHWNALEIQLEFQRRNIPFQVRGGLRFFEQAHIKDVLSFLRIVHNPRDELSWLRVLQMLPKVGSRLSQRLWECVGAAADPIAAALLPETAELLPRSVRGFYTVFTGLLQSLTKLRAPAEMIGEIQQRFYDDYLHSHYDNAALRREDIKGFASFSSQYTEIQPFLADITLADEFSGETIVSGPTEDKYVTLSTVHQAKGLEWPVVIIPWLADGRFPTDFAINTPEEEEEERRVFHVAVTRARDELYLVVPQVYRTRGKGFAMMKPSRFITEIDEGLTERMELDEGLPETMVGVGTPSGGARKELDSSIRTSLPSPEAKGKGKE